MSIARIKMNKRADKILVLYWYFVIIIVAVAVAIMSISFYGAPYDVREIEKNLLTERIADCFVVEGYLREDFFSQDFKDNFEEKCRLNFNTEKEFDWDKEGQYYAKISFFKFDENAERNEGQKISEINEGNVNLKIKYLLEEIEKQRVRAKKDTIVIHFTATPDLTSAQNEFWNTPKSIHYLIDKDGNIFRGEKEESESAVHVSETSGINEVSIGIELVNLGHMCGATTGYCNWGTGTCKSICEDAGKGEIVNGIVWEKFTQEQITALEELVSEIAVRWGIPADRQHIKGHSEIDTKTRVDPGPLFPWIDFMNEVIKKAEDKRMAGKSLYALDKAGNKYVIKITAFVGKSEKNEI